MAAGFARLFGWLGRVTGPTRDLDVHLSMVESYCQSVSNDAAMLLAPMISVLRKRHDAARKELVGQIDSDRYRNLKHSWREILNSGFEADPPTDHKGDSTRVVSSRRIWRVYRRILRSGAAITPSSPASHLHDLRKEAKKLRYMIEFFSSLYPTRAMGRATSALKQLQNNLGDFNDCEVQHETIQRIADELMNNRACYSANILAMGALLEHLAAGQRRARREFQRCFGKFSSPRKRKLFIKLFQEGEVQ